MLGLGCGLVSWIDKFRTPGWRPYRAAMFVGLGASGVVPMVQGIQTYGFEAMDERMSLRLVILQGLIYMFGAFLYAVWPTPSLVTFVSVADSCERWVLTVPRPGGRRGPPQASSTSGAAPTRSSTSASCSRLGRTCTPWRGPLTTTTPSWARSAPELHGHLNTPVCLPSPLPEPRILIFCNKYRGIIIE